MIQAFLSCYGEVIGFESFCSCEQTNTEKFEGSGSIHPSSYEFRQRAFLTFVY